MSTYHTPGIYVEEIPSGPRPIEPVGTSTAGFVGVAPNAEAHVHEAVAVNNVSQFLRGFCGENASSTPLSHAVMGFFLNGGSRCYVVNVGENGPIAGTQGGRKGLAALETMDEVSIVAAPGYTDAASYDAVLSHCESMGDRVAILDAREDIKDIDSLTKTATGRASGGGGAKPRQSDRGFGAFYFPWVLVADPLSPTREQVSVPPSGHLAGIYARTDATRGVHKAPANEPIRGALDLTYLLTRGENGLLNQNGVNCIRIFPAEGIRVWGARTLAASASEWRYVNVRRLFNMIEESIARNTRWVVFEPNDVTLWQAIRRDVSAFLTNLWRDGALMGATPEEAFFVKCDAETNPPEVIDAGQVVTVVGIAPVKPAEFVIFQIRQEAGGTQIS
jgi:phage tail sheath protein FI